MKNLRVGIDSSCIIGLSPIEKFQLLKDLFSEIYIPNAVYQEVVVYGKDRIGAKETEEAIQKGWLKRIDVKDKLAVQALLPTLGRGESEVIILGRERELDFVLIDEVLARKIAKLMGLKIVGAIGIIDLAIGRGFQLNKKALVDELINLGFRISKKLYNKIFSKFN